LTPASIVDHAAARAELFAALGYAAVNRRVERRVFTGIESCIRSGVISGIESCFRSRSEIEALPIMARDREKARNQQD
jgi:hypothetical protein